MSFKFTMSCRQIQVTPEYEMEKSLFEACLEHYHATEQAYFDRLRGQALVDVNTGEELAFVDGELKLKEDE